MENLNNNIVIENAPVNIENLKMKQKEYNKIYYAKNKVKILNNLSRKIKCPKCERQVAMCNFTRHQTNKICKKYEMLNKLIIYT